MAIFKKNANESAYVGGKKHFADVIKNTGSGDFLVWRQPEEDFNNGSTLIVMPGEEAIFINGGIIEQTFSSGTYKLSTKNYPFISRLKNALTGGISAFNCVVYFVNKSLSVEVKWGTDSPIQVRDKQLGIATKLKARGAYKLCVNDAKIFITKMLGNNMRFQHPQDLDNYFFNEFQSKIRSVIAKALNEQEEELLGIDAKLDEFSATITPFFQDVLDEYGLKCMNFVVSAIDIDDNRLRTKYDEIGMDVYEKMRQGDIKAQNTVKQGTAEAQVSIMQGQAEAQIKLQKGLIEAQIMVAQGKAQKEIMDALGEAGWSKQNAAEILKALANNSGSGAFASTAAGLGVGIAMCTPFANLASQMTSPLTQQECEKERLNPTVEESITKQEINIEDVAKILNRLKELCDEGLITQDEYAQKKKEILAKL